MRKWKVSALRNWLAKLLSLAVLLGACGQPIPPKAPLTPVTVQLTWQHQVEFAGFYAADQLGYYADEGLDVSLVEGGPEVNSIAPVVNGAAEFGIAQPADLIIARADGKPVRSIAVIYRRNPIVFFALADSGIQRPQDFVGKNIRSTLTVDQILRAMMAKIGVASDQYQVEYLPSDITKFASGKPQVWSGFINVFVPQVQRAGYKINIIYPDDYGIHFYGDVLMTTDDLIARDPELVKRFTRATLNGWKYAVENPAAIGAMVKKYNPNANLESENANMTASIPLINTGEDFIGWMTPEIWTGIEQTLREQGLLVKDLDLNQVYTMKFLKEIYNK